MPPPISIVMRSKNDGPLIGAVLRSVYDQDYPGGVELVHIDSGSTDDTVEIINSTHPWKLIQIKAEEYVPGVVLNRGMRESRSEWVVFLNSDAEPVNRSWLSELIAAAQAQEKTGTAFSRQVPRPDCQAVYAFDYDRCFGPERESANWPHFFSMVSCIVNRQAWEEQPFREDLQYAEDDEWSRRLKDHGWGVAFAEKSLAIHSHNYTFKQAYKRAYGDCFAAAATRKEFVPRPFDWIIGLVKAVLRDASMDLKWCLRHSRSGEWPHAIGVRVAQRLGRTFGYRDGWQHYHGTPTKQ
ncbi:MAG: glycosyltransferase family A protein [Verrucomicrobiota bacterium]